MHIGEAEMLCKTFFGEMQHPTTWVNLWINVLLNPELQM